MAIRLSWNQPFTNTDGSAFDLAQYQRYEVQFDALPVQALAVTWDADGAFNYDADVNLPDGPHTGRIRVVNKTGTSSAWSNTASFTVTKVPEAPTSFSVG
jgi:hypothetical protein